MLFKENKNYRIVMLSTGKTSIGVRDNKPLDTFSMTVVIFQAGQFS